MEIFTQIAKDYGLFVALVAYILWFFDRLLKNNKEEMRVFRAENVAREARYISVIDKLSDSFVDLTTEVAAIKVMMEHDRGAGRRVSK